METLVIFQMVVKFVKFVGLCPVPTYPYLSDLIHVCSCIKLYKCWSAYFLPELRCDFLCSVSLVVHVIEKKIQQVKDSETSYSMFEVL
jgi:hypothetical protein